ncbi:MAG: hypothetical protein IPG45_17760 [Deltaproteobacteria bacterium]|nr:hypothetical protein [Deltaproteobacteria bacterium]
MRWRLLAVLSVLSSCSGDITGTLEIGPIDEGRAFQVVFTSEQPVAEGKIYLEFQAVGTTLVLQGASADTHGCLPLPSTQKLVVITGPGGLPPGARVRVSAWHYEAPTPPKGSTEPVEEVPVAERCAGIVVADATYTVPDLPDAGFAPDATIEVDGGEEGDAGVEADAEPGDDGVEDAGPLDADGLDADPTDTSTTGDAGLDPDAGPTDTGTTSMDGGLTDTGTVADGG